MAMTGKIALLLSQADSNQEDPDEEEEQFDLAKITWFQDATSSLETVQTFVDSKGFLEEAARIATSMNKLTYFRCASLDSARQSTLDEYFHPA